MKKYYYLYKQGMYGHGVFWIGTDEAEGIRQANVAAHFDRDNYHSWDLCVFENCRDYHEDAAHEVVYSVRCGDDET